MADAAHDQVHIAAPVATCFAVATDFEAYPSWAGDVKHARVVERDAEGRGRRVDFRVAALGRSIRYVLDYDYAKAPEKFSWTLVEGDSLRVLEGAYTFVNADDGTDVGYELSVELAIPVPGLVKRRAAQRIVSTALVELKHAVEARAEGSDSQSDHGVVPAPEPAAEPGHAGASDPESVPFDEVGREERTLPAPSTVEIVLTELFGAVPEVRDHLLAAADELLDAAMALLEAADRTVRRPHEDGR
jgi:hypothetical protein